MVCEVPPECYNTSAVRLWYCGFQQRTSGYDAWMGFLALVLLVVIALIAWAPQQATQVAIAGIWVLSAVWIVGLILYYLGRALFS